MAQCLGSCSLRVQFGATTSKLGLGSCRSSRNGYGYGNLSTNFRLQSRPRAVWLAPVAALESLIPLVDGVSELSSSPHFCTISACHHFLRFSLVSLCNYSGRVQIL